MLAGVAYHYWRGGLNSVETGQQLGIKPPHVRQLLWRLSTTAGRLGYGPRKTIQQKPETIAKQAAQRDARQADKEMRAAAQKISRLLGQGKTWRQAKAAVGDYSKHNHDARFLLKHYGLPCKATGTRRDETRAKQMARLRAKGWSFGRIGKKFGVDCGSVHSVLKRRGLQRPAFRGH